MHATKLALLAAASLLALAGCGMLETGPTSGPLKLVSDTKLPGPFTFPESVGCDAVENVLYVSQFGGKELKPAEKDGLGYVSKVSREGKVLEQRAFDVKMNKPKGIWVHHKRLWVTDIDGVWIFDTTTKGGRKLDLPGIQFANDVAVAGNVLYVSDNRSDQLFRVEPADFLAHGVQPKVSVVWSKAGINPNGLYPARDGSLIVVGFLGGKPEEARGISMMDAKGNLKPRGKPIGRLDGVFESRDGSLLVTDWNTGSIFQYSEERGMETLAKGFKGPADFCVLGDTAYVPDLPGSEIRAIRLAR
jgi:hypothetical protein